MKYAEIVRRAAEKRRVLTDKQFSRGDGGPGSGNFGHAGRPGMRGGSGKGIANQIKTKPIYSSGRKKVASICNRAPEGTTLKVGEHLILRKVGNKWHAKDEGGTYELTSEDVAGELYGETVEFRTPEGRKIVAAKIVGEKAAGKSTEEVKKAASKLTREVKEISDKSKHEYENQTEDDYLSKDYQLNKEGREWRQSLSVKEVDAIHGYTDGSGYFNSLIATGEKLDAFYTERRDLLDSAISKYELKEPVKVFSGGALHRFGIKREQILDGSLVGKTLKYKAYLSASLKAKKARNFLPADNDDKLILDIDVPKGKGRGAYLEQTTTIHGEYELLLHRGTRYKVKGGYLDAKETPHVVVDLVK